MVDWNCSCFFLKSSTQFSSKSITSVSLGGSNLPSPNLLRSPWWSTLWDAYVEEAQEEDEEGEKYWSDSADSQNLEVRSKEMGYNGGWGNVD